MTEQIEAFYKSLAGKKVAFIGTGVTNQSCIELFAKHGALITLCDQKPSLEAFGPLARRLQALDIRFSLGPGYLQGLKGQDMIMRTPGFGHAGVDPNYGAGGPGGGCPGHQRDAAFL